MKVPTSCAVLDRLLGGGIEKGIITTFFGPAGSGKSNIALIVATHFARQGNVLFIDTEGGFSLERLAQICPDHKKILKRILLIKLADFKEQKEFISKLPTFVCENKIVAIVVDSIVMLYRLQLGSEADVAITNKDMANQLAILSAVARNFNIPVLVTNQVYADFDKPNSFKMVGGDLLKYWSKCIIKLDHVGPGVRKASIYKHRSLPEGRSVLFEIVDSGLREVKKRFSLF